MGFLENIKKVEKKDKSGKQKYDMNAKVMSEVHEVNEVCKVKVGVQQVKYKTSPKQNKKK